MSATTRNCPHCHNLLSSPYETSIGQCVACHLFPRGLSASSIEAPASNVANLLIMARHAEERRAAGNDGGLSYADYCRLEANIDCNRDLTRVECSVCASGCLVDHAPDGPYVCDYCAGERQERDPWD